MKKEKNTEKTSRTSTYILINLEIMSTRANIYIRKSYCDRGKEILYHHYDGYPKGVGRDLTRILDRLPKDSEDKVLPEYLDKKRLAEFICEQDSDFKITTPYSAGDAEFEYEINIEKRRVDWYATSVSSRSGEEEWLCDF